MNIHRLERRHCLQLLPGLALAATWPAAATEAQQLRGEARMSWFGLHIYDVRLWAAEPPRSDWWTQDLTLELLYARSLKGRDIAERSLKEMRRQQDIEDAQARRWLAAMESAFPDVRDGDRIAGRHLPGVGAAFSHNGQPTGRIEDSGFARLFFGIWLSPQTSEPALRRRLLGLASP